jgi:DNA-directed RNA polymerase specialized sigma24 family protein
VLLVLTEATAAALDPQERMFVHLRYAQGLTIREIAEQLDVSEGVAWHRGRRSLDKLSRHLRGLR